MPKDKQTEEPVLQAKLDALIENTSRAEASGEDNFFS